MMCCACIFSVHGDEREDLEVLRLTVVNLLQGMVQKGILTPNEAAGMVASAQESAQAEADALNQPPEEDQVRVTYVPEVVKEELREDMREELAPQIVDAVIDQAQENGWAMADALPEWLQRTTISGDLRIRGRGDFYDSGNALNTYRDFQRINEAGGEVLAGIDAFANVSEDRQRMLARLRLGITSQITDNWLVNLRLMTGNSDNPVSGNATLADYGGSYEISLDRASVTYSPQWNSLGWQLQGGRMGSPWLGTDIIYDNDLNFDGLVARLQTNGGNGQWFWTTGGFPIDEVSRSSRDKWLLGTQLGWIGNPGNATQFEFALAYHDFQNITGKRNTLDSVLLDFTAPAHLQRGNTLFDIRNDNDNATNLYALAADYDVASIYAGLSLFQDQPIGASLAVEYVKNIGYDEADVLARTGVNVAEKSIGYIGELEVGHHDLNEPWNWRVIASYRFLERDAVLDAFAESTLHNGGTDSQGYELAFELGMSPRSWLTLSWLSADEIDGEPLGIDILQLDLNNRF